MSDSSVFAPPTSRAKLRKVAEAVREATGTANSQHFPIVGIMEQALHFLAKDYTFHVETIAELGDDHGLTDFNQKEVCIREDVYERAVDGHGRDRFTMAHELGHAILHTNVSLARRMGNSEKVETFRDPEWQADCFAGELLIPIGYVRSGPTIEEIAKSCGVSFDAAKVAIKVWRREQ